MEEVFYRFPQGGDASEPEAHCAQVSHTHIPDKDPAGPVSECTICAYRPQSLCGVSFHHEPVEIIVQCSWAAMPEI